MTDVPAPPNAPEVPASPQDWLNNLDAGGEAAADDLDHDLDGPLPTPEAPQPPAPAAAPVPAVPAAPPAPEPPKMVPVAELATERQKRQEAQRRAEQLEEENARLRQPAPQPAAPPAPPPEPDVDYLEDPKGYVDQQVKRALAKLQEPLEKATEQSTRTAQDQAQMRAMSQLVADIGGAEATFKQQHPDYEQALLHLRNLRAQELRVFAPEGTTDDQIINYIRVEELRGAAAMLQGGKNPAQVAYEYAKVRGYKPPDPTPPAPPNREEARGLPDGGGAPEGLQPSNDQSNVMPEFAAARRERFGIGR